MVDSPPGQANLNLNMLDAWASFSLALPFFSSDKAMAPCNCRCKVLARLQKPCAQVVDSCPTGPQHQSGNSGSAAIHARPHMSSELARAGAAACPCAMQLIRCMSCVFVAQPRLVHRASQTDMNISRKLDVIDKTLMQFQRMWSNIMDTLASTT